jgi:hypothetical protein
MPKEKKHDSATPKPKPKPKPYERTRRVEGSKARKEKEEEEEEEEVGGISVCENLGSLLGGRLVCKEDELTREVLLEHLFCVGSISRCHVRRVTIQQLGGREIHMDVATTSIKAIKKTISRLEGIAPETQTLRDVNGTGEALADNTVIQTACVLVLTVGATTFSWDSESLHMDNALARAQEGWRFEEDVLFFLDQDDPRTVCRYYARERPDHVSFRHTMAAVPSMTPFAQSAGIYTISVTFEMDTIFGTRSTPPVDDRWPRIGAIGVGKTTGNMQHNVTALSMHTANGKLCNMLVGGGKALPAGKVPFGSVLTMQLDYDKKTLHFWVNGARHGEGYHNILRIPMQWGILAPHDQSIVTIVDQPEILEKAWLQ